MRVVFLGLMLVLVATARGQFLGGIFEQGATELREYGEQIAALALLIDRSEKGYRIVEGGLADISGITGTEYGLHQAYFGSLAAVNPVVAQMAEVGAILSLEAGVVSGMDLALKRWRASGRLTAGEMGVVEQVYAGVMQTGAQMVTELRAVLVDGVLVMGDGERVAGLSKLDKQIMGLNLAAAAYTGGVDLLVARRMAATR